MPGQAQMAVQHLSRSLEWIRHQAACSLLRVGWSETGFTPVVNGLAQHCPKPAVDAYRRELEVGGRLSRELAILDAIDSDDPAARPYLDAARFVSLERAALDEPDWSTVSTFLREIGPRRVNAIADLAIEPVTYSLGRSAVRTGDWSSGVELLARDRVSDPDHQRIGQLVRGASILETKPVEGVRVCLDALRDYESFDALPWALLCRHGALVSAETLLADAAWAEVLRLLSAAAAEDPDLFAYQLLTCGLALTVSGNSRSARELIQRAIRMAPALATRLRHQLTRMRVEFTGDDQAAGQLRAIVDQLARDSLPAPRDVDN